MGWLSNILKGSSNKGQFHGKSMDECCDEPQQSLECFSDFDKEEIDRTVAISLVEDLKGKSVVGNEFQPDHNDHQQAHKNEKRASTQLEEDEQLAKALQESLIADSLHGYDVGSIGQYNLFFPPTCRVCAGCKNEIGYGRTLSCMDQLWHPDCFCCHACNQPIADYGFAVYGDRPYHKSCYKEQHHPKCDVCNCFIPYNLSGLIEYRAHPFWGQKYCPLHEHDGTSQCCSCERMENQKMRFLSLNDGRALCLECLDSVIMETNECQPLHIEIRHFYEGLNMTLLEQQIPLLLVERQALNDAMAEEKHGHHHLPETRGLCLSEEQTIKTISRRPKIERGFRLVDMTTEYYRLSRRCEVTAILILYGLPRLLTGSILAHEMMHAWLRLKAFPNLDPKVEEGICQVLAHMWLESEIYSASSSTASSSSSSKKGKRSDFEKKLGDFFKRQIEADKSPAYGDGFRLGNAAVHKYGLKNTLEHIRLTGNFPL